jgi:hypothetical protein
MSVYFDLAIIQRNLAKAKADVEFWERANSILSDPRIAGTTTTPQFSLNSKPVYGELRKQVHNTLPEHGQKGISIKEIVRLLLATGYVFSAKLPGVAVNDALRLLAKSGDAIKSDTEGLAHLWTKGESQEPAEAGS